MGSQAMFAADKGVELETLIARRITPDLTQDEERRWLEAAKSGDEAALERLFSRHHASVRCLCVRMLGNSPELDDVVQNAFVLAFRALPKFRGDACLKTWLYRIVMNECASLIRRKRQATLPLDDELEGKSDASETLERLAIQKVLGELHADYRSVLVLHYWEQLSCEEIATILKISSGAVKMRLKRAREAFEKVYGGER